MPLNFTNETTPTGLDHFALGVGIGYTCAGVVFIYLQLVCAYLIYVDKEMQNPTYKLMVNLSITDAIELIPIGAYAGITILTGVQYPSIQCCMSFVCLSAWYANCVLFVFIGFSRWIAITRSHLVANMFR